MSDKVKIEMSVDEAGYLLNVLDAYKFETEHAQAVSTSTEPNPFEMLELECVKRIYGRVNKEYKRLSEKLEIF